MSEERPQYITDAEEMINTQPTVEIEPPRSVISRRGREFIEEDRPAFIKFSTGFKKELAGIDEIALKVWVFIALSINRNSGKANPGLRTIADGTGFAINTVRSAVARLETKYNLLLVDRESRKYNIYEPTAFVSANRADPTVSPDDTPYTDETPSVSVEAQSVSLGDESVSAKPPSVSPRMILNQINQRNQNNHIDNFSSSSSSKKVPEGFPEPSGDGLGDWLEMGRRIEVKNNAPASVMERLASMNKNWPKFGENKDFDRVCRNIVKAEKDTPGMVEKFIAWVKEQKKPEEMIRWYGVKPWNIWNDIGVCFGENKPISIHDKLDKQIEEEKACALQNTK